METDNQAALKVQVNDLVISQISVDFIEEDVFLLNVLTLKPIEKVYL